MPTIQDTCDEGVSSREDSHEELAVRLLDALLPSPCLACGSPARRRRPPLGLCPRCRTRLLRRAPTPPSAPGETDGGTDRCPPGPWDEAWVGGAYEAPLDSVIRAFKFRRLDFLARDLALHLVAGRPGAGRDIDLIVPVPLHWTRYLGRGFDQAHRIAQHIGRLLGRPCVSALRRPRRTRPQTSLSRERRRRNVEGAFRPRRATAARVRGAHVLLVDDVVTTGATATAAATALRELEPRSVSLAVLAVAPEPGSKRKGPRPRTV